MTDADSELDRHAGMFGALCKELGYCLHDKGQKRVRAAMPDGLDAVGESGARRRRGRLPEFVRDVETPDSRLTESQSARRLANDSQEERKRSPRLGSGRWAA